ncbi:MAG: DUF3822 family protein [Segetibacter sp.]
MPNKSFSIYNSDKDAIADIDDRLVLEVGRTHMACIIKKEHKKTISAFELFSFTENEAADFAKLFKAVAADSKLLAKSYPATQVFINNETSLLVPIFNFNNEIAVNYLDVVFGEDPISKIQFEHLPVEPGMMNVYRVQEDLLNILYGNLTKVTLKHTWSNIIKTVISNISSFPPEFIYIQFYNTSIIAVVMKDKKLQLIQSFIYEASEDVLYHLLNIAEQFKFNNDKLPLQISGLIDLNYTLYRELITYFRNVKVKNMDTSKLLPDIKEYPLHYFTPFFNLAL